MHRKDREIKQLEAAANTTTEQADRLQRRQESQCAAAIAERKGFAAVKKKLEAEMARQLEAKTIDCKKLYTMKNQAGVRCSN